MELLIPGKTTKVDNEGNAILSYVSAVKNMDLVINFECWSNQNEWRSLEGETVWQPNLVIKDSKLTDNIYSLKKIF